MTSPTKLRIGYIPEHFASPLLILARSAWGKEHLELVPCPSGTGQVLSAFDASRPAGQDIDVAIALTESLIAGIAKGRHDLRLVGTYVRSSLVWAVIAGAQATAYNAIGDLRGTTMGISRLGSGSQVMASVMALNEGWAPSDVSFKVNDTFANLRNSVNDGSTSAFMWETFTTKPYFDSKEVREIGQVPTPWPGWSIVSSVATTLQNQEQRALLDTFLDKLQESIANFTSSQSFAANTPREFIVKELQYQPADVDDWLETVRWVGDARSNSAKQHKVDNGQNTTTATVSRQTLAKTLKTLHQAGVLSEEQAVGAAADPSIFVDPWGNGTEGRLVA
ncbi:unnamed protein product [Parajaminaea phylloscopi]